MRHHVHMATVKLTFVDGEGQTGVTEVNSLIRSTNNKIGVELLARAQQGATITLLEKLNDPTVQILDAVFTGMFYLGHMTDEEFNKRTPVKASGQATDPEAGKIFEPGSATGIQDNA